jgi:hypothetical protein
MPWINFFLHTKYQEKQRFKNIGYECNVWPKSLDVGLTATSYLRVLGQCTRPNPRAGGWLYRETPESCLGPGRAARPEWLGFGASF